MADALWIKLWPINHADAQVGRVVAQRQHCCFSPDQQKSGDDTNVEKKGCCTGMTRSINHCWDKEEDTEAAAGDIQRKYTTWCYFPTWILHQISAFLWVKCNVGPWLSNLRIHIFDALTLHLAWTVKICSFPQGGENKKKVTFTQGHSDLNSAEVLERPHQAIIHITQTPFGLCRFVVKVSPSIATDDLHARPPGSVFQKHHCPLSCLHLYLSPRPTAKKQNSAATTPTLHFRPITEQFSDTTCFSFCNKQINHIHCRCMKQYNWQCQINNTLQYGASHFFVLLKLSDHHHVGSII